ncbi:MAG TPA: flavodoxin family protein [Candidatus Methanoculleus thermohydrogenotrophicum]|jgi:multimeric flavodoxin WrbA|nr:flavodoxin family protein [Candidatus Methanoculleus thermohydrogenotrophicum]NLM82363.1 flavodoxin family protein [Candidatus Methanoculleus thermohydrogenotrophicum]HOB17207.1 flavodoxin family protein [Candidatus Methanoculleus thermohydrogenotrophicum]HPZ37287.1 flavodoxin family protein [Candidatus Methanoculleus thermohydrogenotrophicum]HQC90500.1 flavodoxin family protein [Candidatus Methanoculleus thermohydrogenotrophicum]
MTIDVLAFATSPRRHGNSETLLDWVLAAMEREGETAVEKIVVPEVDIRPCRGCNACEMLNRCVQRDDMDYIHDRIIAADCIILASPIYCMGLAAQAKVLVDRAQVFRSRKYVLHLPVVPPERKGKRVGIFLSTAGQTWDYVFDAAIPSVKCFFNVIDIGKKDVRYLMVNGVDEKGAITRHPTAMRDAETLAGEVITGLREAGVV